VRRRPFAIVKCGVVSELYVSLKGFNKTGLLDRHQLPLLLRARAWHPWHTHTLALNASLALKA